MLFFIAVANFFLSFQGFFLIWFNSFLSGYIQVYFSYCSYTGNSLLSKDYSAVVVFMGFSWYDKFVIQGYFQSEFSFFAKNIHDEIMVGFKCN